MFNRILFVTTVATCLATAAGFLGRHWWVFELASHFRVQYFYLLMVCGLIFLAGGRHRGAILAGAFALVNLYLIGSPLGGITVQASVPSGKAQVLRALLANVSHDNQAYQKLYRLVYSATPDFMVLLEINNTWVRALQPLLNDYPHSQVKVDEKFGIALLSRIPFENAAIKIIGKAELPFVIARFNVKGQRFTLIGTHPHSPTDRTHAEYRNNQLADLAQFVSEQEDPIILLGDLNISPWSPIFKDFLRSTGLRDSREGFGLQTSWPTWFPPAWIPIDHGLVSSGVFVHDRWVGPHIGSDHYPVILDFSLSAKPKE